jgi:yeast amino acid transporter
VILISFQLIGWSVFLKNGWNTTTFVTDYFPFILFPLLYVGAMFYYRVPPVKPEDMDFVSDIAQIEADETPEEPAKNILEAVWKSLVSVVVSCRLHHVSYVLTKM